RAATLYRGFFQNRLPDSTSLGDFHDGVSGKNGHEVCMDVPPGVSKYLDPDCAECRLNPDGSVPDPVYVLYQHGHCIWTDADCDRSTGVGGFETQVHWLDPGTLPTAPDYHIAPADHAVTIAWDNQPEILLNAKIAGGGDYSFTGYHVYRLSDWRRRVSQLPPIDRWEQIGSFGSDSLNAMQPLAVVTDSTVGYDLIRYHQKHYPIGRYRFTDHQVLNGFDYLYL